MPFQRLRIASRDSSPSNRAGVVPCILFYAKYASKAILLFMTRTTIEIDDEALAGAARELGTTSKVDTVNAALAFVAKRHQLAQAFDDPAIWGSPDMADPEVRNAARR